jgi:hypothetical protein
MIGLREFFEHSDTSVKRSKAFYCHDNKIYSLHE